MVVFKGRTLSVEMKDGHIWQTYTPTTDLNFVIQHLVDKGVRIIAKQDEDDVNPLIHYILSWVPAFILYAVSFRFVGVRIVSDRKTARRIAALEAKIRNLENNAKS